MPISILLLQHSLAKVVPAQRNPEEYPCVRHMSALNTGNRACHTPLTRPMISSMFRLFLPLVALTLVGCTLFDPKPPGKAFDKMAVVPPDFLYSRYEPMNRWLDTAVRVQIFDVPLTRVIYEPCLRGINVRVIQAPVENPNIFIDKLALTRRQLLWSLAQDHQLHLTPVFDANGGPAWIEIRSRQASNDARARGDT